MQEFTAITYRCPLCDWHGGYDDLDTLSDARERVSAGELVPAGECPTCGELIDCPDAAIPDYTLEAVARVMAERGWIVVRPEPATSGIPVTLPFADAFAAAFVLVVESSYALLAEGDFEGEDPGEVRAQLDGALTEAASAFGLEESAETLGELSELILGRERWEALNEFLIDTTE